MPQTTTADDDLIIISDDKNTEESDTQESSQDSVEQVSTPDVLNIVWDSSPSVSDELSFDLSADTPQAESDTVVQEAPVNSQEESTEVSLWDTLELSTDEAETSSADTVTQTVEVVDVASEWEEVNEVSDLGATEVSSVTETESMNDILQSTISKLSSRKNIIAETKKWKLIEIDQHKQEITVLEWLVSDLTSQVESLDAESTKIDENVSSLESMKIAGWNTISEAEVDVKAHNKKRVMRTEKV